MRDQLQDTSVSNSHQQALHGGAQGSQVRPLGRTELTCAILNF